MTDKALEQTVAIFKRKRFKRRIAAAAEAIRFHGRRMLSGITPPGDEPYFDAQGVEAFKRQLARATCYLEFGSGGSTVLVDRAGIPGTSVESDRGYAKAVRSRLRGGKIRVIWPDIGVTGPWGRPVFRRHSTWRRYIEAPFPMNPFPDFILIDGRFRVACALETADQAHALGVTACLMFDDYAPRTHYHVVEEYLGRPRLVGRAAFFEIGGVAIPRSAIARSALHFR